MHISVAQPPASNDAYKALQGCLTCFSQLVFVDMNGNFGILPCFSHIQLFWGVWLTLVPEEPNLSHRLDLQGKTLRRDVIMLEYVHFIPVLSWDPILLSSVACSINLILFLQ